MPTTSPRLADLLDPEIFGERLRYWRTAAGLGLNELARRRGVPPLVISRAETGHGTPAWRTILALAKALGRTPNDFAGLL
jgi:transcriptional regulator with XRE-family HTH domain